MAKRKIVIIELDKDIQDGIDKLQSRLKTIPDIIINVILKIGLKELSEAYELLPLKYKKALNFALKESGVLQKTEIIS